MISDGDEVFTFEASLRGFAVFECGVRAVVYVVSHPSADEADRSGTVTPIAFLKGTLFVRKHKFYRGRIPLLTMVPCDYRWISDYGCNISGVASSAC